MKNFLPALAGVLAIAFTQPVSGQPTPCGVKGIRTNIAHPKLGTGAYNPEYPLRTNTFNWYQGQVNGGVNWNPNSVATNEPDISFVQRKRHQPQGWRAQPDGRHRLGSTPGLGPDFISGITTRHSIRRHCPPACISAFWNRQAVSALPPALVWHVD